RGAGRKIHRRLDEGVQGKLVGRQRVAEVRELGVAIDEERAVVTKGQGQVVAKLGLDAPLGAGADVDGQAGQAQVEVEVGRQGGVGEVLVQVEFNLDVTIAAGVADPDLAGIEPQGGGDAGLNGAVGVLGLVIDAVEDALHFLHKVRGDGL